MPKEKKRDENNNPQEEDFLTPEQSKIIDDEAVEITKGIVDSIKLDDDEKNALKNSDVDSGLQMELDQFINDKVEIDNSCGGQFMQIKTGVDLLDHLSGGGFNVGGFTMVIGNPGSFKSTLMAQIIGYNQKVYNGQMLTVYFDTEASMTTKRLAQLGVKNPLIKPYSDCTVEKLFKTIEAICAYKQTKGLTEIPTIIVWDSIANTSTDAERGTDNINSTMGLKQKLISQLLPRYLNKMVESKICLLGINQMRDRLNVGMYAPAPDLMHTANFEIPGGKALKYNASHMLKLQNRGEIKKEMYEFDGAKVEIEFLKNKAFSSYIKAPIIVDYKHGVSNFWTNYTLLVDNAQLKPGAWNYLIKYPEKKFRTKDAPETYETDPKFKEVFDNAVKEVLNTVYPAD